MKEQDKKAYYDSLPRKRSAVGVLIFRGSKLLILKPSYANHWLVPGGVVEAFESPLEAAIRECKEEIGVEVSITSFLCADYKRGSSEIGDAVHYLFLGILSSNDELVLGPTEIAEADWIEPIEAVEKFDAHLSTRVRAGLHAIKVGRSLYCEDGEIKM